MCNCVGECDGWVCFEACCVCTCILLVISLTGATGAACKVGLHASATLRCAPCRCTMGCLGVSSARCEGVMYHLEVCGVLQEVCGVASVNSTKLGSLLHTAAWSLHVHCFKALLWRVGACSDVTPCRQDISKPQALPWQHSLWRLMWWALCHKLYCVEFSTRPWGTLCLHTARGNAAIVVGMPCECVCSHSTVQMVVRISRRGWVLVTQVCD